MGKKNFLFDEILIVSRNSFFKKMKILLLNKLCICKRMYYVYYVYVLCMLPVFFLFFYFFALRKFIFHKYLTQLYSISVIWNNLDSNSQKVIITYCLTLYQYRHITGFEL